MARSKNFYFVLVSEDKDNKLYPQSFRGRELGEFLSLLDDMLSSTISGQIGTDCGGLRVEGITKGSTCIVCHGTSKQVAAFNAVSNEINSGRYTGKTRKYIDKIRTFNSTYSSRLEFRPKKRGPAIATVVPLTRKQSTMPPLSVSVDTTLYGKISGINGVSKIRVTLSLLGLNGTTDFIVSKKDDIHNFCSRYGEIVGVSGKAEIRLPENEVIKFSFSELAPYQEKSITDVVYDMREKFGSCFNTVHDIDLLVREQRG